MTAIHMMGKTRTGVIATAAAAPLVVVAIGACGSGNQTATPVAPKTASGQLATVGLESDGTLGKILVDSRGRTLYLFKRDASGKSACDSACAAAWPPLRADGKPVAGRGLTPARLGTTPRSDGRRQIAYNGHPLYRYTGDHKLGDTNGQGVNAFGAPWFTVSGAGEVVSRPGPNPSGGGY